MRFCSAALPLVIVVAACGKKTERESEPAATVAATKDSVVILPPVTMPMPASMQHPNTGPLCAHDGTWAACSIEARLKQAGFVLRKADGAVAHRKGFSVAPLAYTLGQSRLEIFLYPDSAAAARDVAAMDTVIAGPRGAPSQWGDGAPTFVRTANLLAVYLAVSQRAAERLALALTAGPPQPGSPR